MNFPDNTITTVPEIIPDNEFFEALRQQEYSRLDENNHVYLDFTGGNLFAKSQVLSHQEMLLSSVLGNPHSVNPSSSLATKWIEETRSKVLAFFNAEDYVCVFTQNASGALKIVGESYPFDEYGMFLLLADNHNSVNGIREFCKKKKGRVVYVPVQYEDLKINDEILQEQLTRFAHGENHLFAFPAQSNVTGVKHDLKWVKIAKEKGFDVLLDAAAFVPSSKLDLSEIQPDFVSVSFYKIFGFPTGIGCLLIHKNAYHKLKKPWFAGGTVTLVSVVSQHRFLATGHERFEDGTLNYLQIPAVHTGLKYIESIGIDRINARVTGLMDYLMHALRGIKHSNGKPVLKIFGPETMDQHGGNIIMTFFDKDGHVIPFETIDEEASAKNISIRSGCFCNPGIDEINNCLTNHELASYFVSRDKGDYHDMIIQLGKMRGATRVSVGIATNLQDLKRWIEFVEQFCDR